MRCLPRGCSFPLYLESEAYSSTLKQKLACGGVLLTPAIRCAPSPVPPLAKGRAAAPSASSAAGGSLRPGTKPRSPPALGRYHEWFSRALKPGKHFVELRDADAERGGGGGLGGGGGAGVGGLCQDAVAKVRALNGAIDERRNVSGSGGGESGGGDEEAGTLPWGGGLAPRQIERNALQVGAWAAWRQRWQRMESAVSQGLRCQLPA